MDKEKYGQLIHPEIKIHRQYFREMVKLLGIYVLYRAPKKEKKYTTYAEIDVNYERPIKIGCIFDEHPSQQSLKKMGWMSELQDNSSIIHVDYDLPNLQQGALFIIPSGLDDGKARLFRVVKMTNSMVYPASVTCEIVPEYINSFDKVTDNTFNPQDEVILTDEPDGPTYVVDEYDLELLQEDESVN
jgi:hypothetical protein